MNREDIIRMAREAGFSTEEWGNGLRHVCVFNFQDSETDVTKEIERFAALVAAAEREACILVLERNADKTLEEIIAAIRARSIK